VGIADIAAKTVATVVVANAVVAKLHKRRHELHNNVRVCEACAFWSAPTPVRCHAIYHEARPVQTSCPMQSVHGGISRQKNNERRCIGCTAGQRHRAS
jgi:Fe-S-cluster-containing hydrogenase component 2